MKKVYLGPIFLLVIWLGFFKPFLVDHKIPIPADITVGMYLPWMDESFGYPVRVPVKNPILTDTISQFWIWRNWAINELKHGQISIWNPHSLAGYPMSPWFHTMLFSPANLTYLIFNQTTAMGSIVAAQLLICLITSYFFLKSLKLNLLSCLFGSISFSFSSFFIAWLTWGTVSWTLAFLPLALLAINKNHPLLLFIAILFSLLGGHPQTFLYCFLVIIGYLLLVKPNNRLFAFLLLALIASAPATLPSIQILKNSIRNHDQYIQSRHFGFISPGYLITTFIAPNFFGNPTTRNFRWDSADFQEKLCWFGTPAFILAIHYLITTLKNKRRKGLSIFLSCFFLTGIFLSLKYPFGHLIYVLKIPFFSTISASRALILTAFSGSIMATLSLNKKINRSATKITTMIVGSIIFAILINLFFLYYLKLPTFKIAARNSFIPFVLSFLTLFFLNFQTKWSRLSLLLLLILSTADGLHFAKKYTPFVSPDLYFPSHPTIDFIKNQPQNDFFRVERQKAEIMPPNSWQPYGFYSTAGYDPVYPLNFSRYLNHQKLILDPSRFIEWPIEQINQIAHLGVKYFFTIKNSAGQKLLEPQWTPVFEHKNTQIWQNNNYSPPYFMENDTQAKVKLISHQDNYWKFEINNQQAGRFVLLENYTPGWSALLNKQAHSIVFHQQTFKSVNLPAGQHILELIYRHPLLTPSFYLSAISLSVVLYLSIKYKDNKK